MESLKLSDYLLGDGTWIFFDKNSNILEFHSPIQCCFDVDPVREGEVLMVCV